MFRFIPALKSGEFSELIWLKFQGGGIIQKNSLPEEIEIPKDIPRDGFEKYWNRFQDSEHFAAIKIGGRCYEEKSDKFLEALSTLNKYGLHPLVVHGGGKQIDDALEKRGISTKKENGVRITSEEAMGVIEQKLKEINKEIVERTDFDCKGLHGIFEANPIKGYTAEAGGITEKGKESLENEKTVIISPVGKYEGDFYNINSDSAWRELVKELEPEKAIMVTGSGGVWGEKGLIYDIEEGRLQETIEEYASGGMKVKLKEASKLVEKGLDVQIASPENLIYELFTNEGKGTYIHSK